MKEIVLTLLLLGTACRIDAGQLVDFETLPDGSTPYDGMVVSNQWAASMGVTFRLANGGLPILATPGGTNYAFSGPPNNSLTNQPEPGENVGRFFLADRASGAPRNFFIEYSSPVSAASGVILDIDHKDAWSIEPRDINGNTFSNYVVTLDTNSPSSGDGVATPWSIQMPSPQIYAIRLHYTGSSTAPGLAFDNFSPTNALPTPTPAHLELNVNTTNALLTLTGTPGALYKIQRATSVASANWINVTNIYLPSSSVLISDSLTPDYQFYRAIGLQ